MEDELWTSKEPLSNAQFRQLLEKPLTKRKEIAEEKRAAKARAERKKKREETAEAEEQFDKVIKEESEEEGGFDSNNEEEEFGNGDRPMYRDRARERREGKESEDFMLEPDTTGRSIEDSKFLGGDFEHTHLVKGLDYALLNKERAKLERVESENAKRKEEEEKAKQRSKGFTFSSTMGRAVFNALFKSTKVDVKDFYKPGRTAFVYDFEDERKMGFVPSVLRRPKSECRSGENYITTEMDSNVVEMLAKIMSYVRSSSANKQDKKQRKKEKKMLLESMLSREKSTKSKNTKVLKDSEPPKQENLPEDDIFEDVGTDYVCDTTKRKSKAERSETLHPPLPPVETSGPISAFQDFMEEDGLNLDSHEHLKADYPCRASGNVRKGRKRDKEMDSTALPDHYAECYPGFHQGYLGVVADSDDEDLSHMDARGKGMSRYDFETDEEWAKYKQKVEQLPKAAFQYGVKMTGGRKTHSKLVDKHRKEQKLDNQLNKIEMIFKDQGHGHDSAFRSDKKQDSKKDDIQLSFPAPKSKKRIKLDQRDES